MKPLIINQIDQQISYILSKLFSKIEFGKDFYPELKLLKTNLEILGLFIIILGQGVAYKNNFLIQNTVKEELIEKFVNIWNQK